MTRKAIGHAKAEPVASTGKALRGLGPAEAIEWQTPIAIHSKCGEASPYLAINTIDGNVGTLWFHNVTCYHWLACDLGSTKTISKLRLYQGGIPFGYNVSVSIFVSDNPADWGTAVWVGSMVGSLPWVESGAFSRAGRYIKILSGSNNRWQSLFEFQIGISVVGAGGPNPGLAKSGEPSLGSATQEIITPASGEQKFE